MSDSANAAAAAGDLSTVRFRPMETSEADLLLFQRAFEVNEGRHSLDLLRWQYFEPPAGRLYVDFAVAETDQPFLAAIYAVFPVFMKVEGRRALGVQSLNTLTDVAFRGKGLFTRMANSVYARCAAEGVAIVYGFPNQNSAHGFFKKLDWKSHDPMPLIFKPLRASYVVSRLTSGKVRLPRWLDFTLRARRPRGAPAWQLRPIPETGAELDQLWRTFSAHIPFAVERDHDYLRWRLRRPNASYQPVALYDGGKMIGCVITAVTRRAGKIMELLSDPDYPGADSYLLDDAVRRLRAAGCDVVWAWNFDHSPNHRAFRRAGFISLPPRLHPTALHAGARSLTIPPSAAAGDRAQWYVSLLDSDTD